MCDGTPDLGDMTAAAYLSLAEAAIDTRDPGAFQQLLDRHVQPLLPHGLFLGVLGTLHHQQLVVERHLAQGYPDWALAHLTARVGLRERPVLQRWLHTRQPVVVNLPADAALCSPRELDEFERMQMGRLAVHGLPDLDNRMGSYFSFGQVTPDLPTTALARRLSQIVPLLHVALCQSLHPAAASGPPALHLTAIEQDLLQWLAEGLSNADIAARRHRSASTVRNQLNALYQKLGVNGRTEAVALAMPEVLHVPAPRVNARRRK